jgi:hypothetical protein
MIIVQDNDEIKYETANVVSVGYLYLERGSLLIDRAISGETRKFELVMTT